MNSIEFSYVELFDVTHKSHLYPLWSSSTSFPPVSTSKMLQKLSNYTSSRCNKNSPNMANIHELQS